MTILKVLSWTLVWRHLLNICRAGSPGAGSYTMSFGMRKKNQVRALQGVMMSGVALWTTDIGGYSGGDPKDPLFQVVWWKVNIRSFIGQNYFLFRSWLCAGSSLALFAPFSGCMGREQVIQNPHILHLCIFAHVDRIIVAQEDLLLTSVAGLGVTMRSGIWRRMSTTMTPWSRFPNLTFV